MNLFNYNLNKLRAETPQGADAIMRTDPEHWSRAWFKIGSFCDYVLLRHLEEVVVHHSQRPSHALHPIVQVPKGSALSYLFNAM